MYVTHVIQAGGLAGVEYHLLTLIPALQARAVHADLLLLAAPESPADRIATAASQAGIPVQVEAMPSGVAPGLLLRLIRRFRAQRPDLVHTHLPAAGVYGTLAARQAGVPHVVSSRYGIEGIARRRVDRWLARWLWRRIDHGIAVNDRVRERTVVAEGARPERMTVVRYGLDAARLRVGRGARTVLCAELGITPPEAPLVGLVCSLDRPDENALDGLQAFWHVSVHHPQAHLLVMGDGPRRVFLEHQARGYGLESHVTFLGWRDDIHAVIAMLDVLMVPCLQAGVDMALLEAMALETPIIACDGGSAAELLVHGETGLLAPSGSVDLLTSSLSLLLEDGELRHKLAAAAKVRLDAGFSVDRMADETLAVYERVLAR